MSMATDTRSSVPAQSRRSVPGKFVPMRPAIKVVLDKPALAAPQVLMRELDSAVIRDGVVSLEPVYREGRIAGRRVIVREAKTGSSASIVFPDDGSTKYIYLDVHADGWVSLQWGATFVATFHGSPHQYAVNS